MGVNDICVEYALHEPAINILALGVLLAITRLSKTLIL